MTVHTYIPILIFAYFGATKRHTFANMLSCLEYTLQLRTNLMSMLILWTSATCMNLTPRFISIFAILPYDLYENQISAALHTML